MAEQRKKKPLLRTMEEDRELIGAMLYNLHMDIWHVSDEEVRARRDEDKRFEHAFKGDLSQLKPARMAFLWDVGLPYINVRREDLKMLTNEERKALGDIGREGLQSRNQLYLSHSVPIERHMKQRPDKWRQILPSLLQDFIEEMHKILMSIEAQYGVYTRMEEKLRSYSSPYFHSLADQIASVPRKRLESRMDSTRKDIAKYQELYDRVVSWKDTL